jgi:hypothetical protein
MGSGTKPVMFVGVDKLVGKIDVSISSLALFSDCATFWRLADCHLFRHFDSSDRRAVDLVSTVPTSACLRAYLAIPSFIRALFCCFSRVGLVSKQEMV